MSFKITSELLEKITSHIDASNNKAIITLFKEMHYADIAEIIEEISFENSIYLIKLLDSEKTSSILTELDEELREKILQNLSAKEIAEEVEELDSDDAADIIGELSESLQEAVMSQIEDEEHVKEIEELLRYSENSAGGLMAKELVKVNENWTVLKCVREMRAQAENVTRVHSIYVVDDQNKLKGRLSLKDLLIASTKTSISDVYIPKVDYVNVKDDLDEVSIKMRKYDLEAIPVVDDNRFLLGRITIDDMVDVIKEEADKDYQLAAGLTKDVEADDSIAQLTKARLPWLFLGLIGGVGAFLIMGLFESSFSENTVLFFFTPLIAAMAGNVGVQSSAIIVQGLANDDVKGSINSRLVKELFLATLNGFVLAIFLFLFVWYYEEKVDTAIAISVSLVAVIIVAGLIGTFVPLFLNKRGLDPAIATGPFITTSNDIFGILIYFMIAKGILGI